MCVRSQGDPGRWLNTGTRGLTGNEVRLVSKVPKSRPAIDDIEARVAALRSEFPGWTVEGDATADVPYLARRDNGDGPHLGAGSYAGLRALLFRQDEADSERALLELSKALADRGAVAIRHSVSIVTRTRTGIARTVSASRGQFIWDSGNFLGPLDAVDDVALKIARLLGLELHPQLAALASHMKVRGYKVGVTPPEVTVTAVTDGTPRAVRVTVEPRPTDEDREWFWTHMGDALAQATDVTGAEVALVGLLAGDS